MNIDWVAAQAIDKVVARLDQGSALALRRDAYFSIARATTRFTSDDEIGSSRVHSHAVIGYAVRMPSAIAAIHFLSAFGVVAAVFGEWLLLSPQPTLSDARRLQRCDALYGLSAIVVVVAGLLRVYRFEKGSDFYLSNPIFLLKVGAFAAAGLLSIYPTIRFIKWRPAMRAGSAPAITEPEYRLIANCIRAELFLLTVMIVCASLMAKGIGL